MIARGNGLDMMLVVPSARIRPEAPDNSADRGESEQRHSEAGRSCGQARLGWAAQQRQPHPFH
jgi:hypothetical protein